MTSRHPRNFYSPAAPRETEQLARITANSGGAGMRFRMLGPLEVVAGCQPVALGGTKQRATLGLLLLHANRVVATSQLIKALWPVDDAPASARKILQNAVWGLRGALLSNDRAENSVALLTHPPGYLLRVEPDQIDLHRFQHLVREGRAKVVSGSPDEAASLLRDALALWSGPPLADLVEAGIDWPELSAVQNARLDAMEDYFEAELACGRHHEVLGELEMMLDLDAPRERSCGQLMLALYRCGRQTDALNVYGRVRSALVENLGLEPGPELKSLQHLILTHDPALAATEVRQHVELRVTSAHGDHVEEIAHRAELRLIDGGAVSAETREEYDTGDSPPDRTDGEVPMIPPARPGQAERRYVSVLMVRTQPGPEFDESTPEQVDEIHEKTAATIRNEVECFGGTVVASIASVSLALFGVLCNRENHADRAVRAALMIRDRLSTSPGPAARLAVPAPGVAIYMAVATGEALVRYPPDNSDIPQSVNGVLLDKCHSLLSQAPVGEIRVCDNTHRVIQSFITSHDVGDSSGEWQVNETRRECISPHAVPVIDREHELEVLRGLLQRTRHRATPQLVTVLGEPGIGKTRFIMEFERRLTVHQEITQLLVGRIPPFGEGNRLAVLTEILSSYCRIMRSDSATTAREKLARTIQRLVRAEEERRWLLTCLSPLIDQEGSTSQVSISEILEAWRQFMEEVAEDRPLVVVIDDLHSGDDILVDFVEQLAESSRSVPLLVIATARPELLKRRPEWGGGSRYCATITLGPISDTAIDRLLEFLLSTMDSELKDFASGLFGTLLTNLSEEPDVRRSYLRKLLTSGACPSP